VIVTLVTYSFDMMLSFQIKKQNNWDNEEVLSRSLLVV